MVARNDVHEHPMVAADALVTEWLVPLVRWMQPRSMGCALLNPA